MRSLSRLLPLLILSVSGAGCVYRMPIQQGNILDPDQIQQIHEGMTRTQVAYVLGTPMVPPSFDNDRWDYYLYIKNRRLKSPFQQRMTIYFKDDKVVRIEKEHIPERPPEAPPEKPPVPASAARDPGPPPTLAPSAESAAAGAANEGVHQ